MEQLLIRRLPAGTKLALKERAQKHGRTSESEAREILVSVLQENPVSIVDLLKDRSELVVDFEPERSTLAVREVEF